MGREQNILRALERVASINCFYCGKSMAASEVELDHIMPRCRFKEKDPLLVPSCLKCNGQKSTMTICEYRVSLGIQWFAGERKLGQRIVDRVDKSNLGAGTLRDIFSKPPLECHSCRHCPDKISDPA